VQLAELGHLSYCSNIHPGETWPEVLGQLQRHLPQLKQQLSPQAPFGVGLRLSAAAADTLCQATELQQFKRWLDEQGLYVFTLNGFPYGPFHGTPLKQGVYRPDWSEAERLSYTRQLADILVALLPEGVDGSISTIPGAFKPDIADRQYHRAITGNLISAAAYLRELARTSGKSICLALEPEPSCMLETVEETLDFFNGVLFTADNALRLAEASGESPACAEKNLRIHLGVCLDTCHAAVMFEEPLDSARRLRAAGIRIAKLQLTAALAIEPMSEEALARLRAFTDPIYLHQTSVKHPAGITHYLDLPEACAGFDPDQTADWRSHYHVPVFLPNLGLLQTTAPALARLLQQHRETPFSQHLEVETYTFDVLPEEYRCASVTDNIRREIEWVRAELQS
jgi:sugar phosphate isomerase/epimerase